MFDVSRSTIGRLLNQEQDLREILLQKERMKQGKRQRSGKDPEVEEALNKWFKSVLDKGVRISGVILRSKAEEFAVRLGKPGFVATEGWLSRWKARHQIKAKRIHGEKSSADFEGAEFWVSTVLPQLLQEYTPENIYNADETGLYYRATPDSSLCYTYEQISGSKRAMERITILLCANMSGKDKLKLLMISKSKKPRCFKNINMDTLPITYCSNQNAWMTRIIFQEWVSKWDSVLRENCRKILLLLDNCPAHPRISTLTNIRLEFLPANTTSLIQPLDQGVIKNLKCFYRQEVVQMTIAGIDDSLVSSSASAIDISSRISLLDAIYFVARSWRKVKPETISNCFRKCGFRTQTSSSGESGDEPILMGEELALTGVLNGEHYLNIDTDIPCFEEAQDFDEEIINEIVSKRICLDDYPEDDDVDDEFVQPIITHQVARQCIQTLQRYFLEQGVSEVQNAALDICAEEVFN